MTKVAHKKIENRKIYFMAMIVIFILNSVFIFYSYKLGYISIYMYGLVEIVTFILFYFLFYDFFVILSSHKFKIEDGEWHLVHTNISRKKFTILSIFGILDIILLNLQIIICIFIINHVFFSLINNIFIILLVFISIIVLFIFNLYLFYNTFLIYLSHNKRYMNSWIFNHIIGKKSFFSFLLSLMVFSNIWGVILFIYSMIELLSGHKIIKNTDIENIE